MANVFLDPWTTPRMSITPLQDVLMAGESLVVLLAVWVILWWCFGRGK